MSKRQLLASSPLEAVLSRVEHSTRLPPLLTTQYTQILTINAHRIDLTADQGEKSCPSGLLRWVVMLSGWVVRHSLLGKDGR